jgi:cell division protease FtsH
LSNDPNPKEYKKDIKNPERGRGTQKQRSSQKGKAPFSSPIKTILMWVLVGTAVFLGLRLIDSFQNLRETPITYTQFKVMLASPDIAIDRAQLLRKGLNQVILRGEVDTPASLAKVPGLKQISPSKIFVVNLPFLDAKILDELDAKGIHYTIEYEKVNVGDVILTIAPWLILILFWVFMFRQMQAGQKGIFSFSKSRAKLHNIDRPQNTFDDAAGVDEAKAAKFPRGCCCLALQEQVKRFSPGALPVKPACRFCR